MKKLTGKHVTIIAFGMIIMLVIHIAIIYGVLFYKQTKAPYKQTFHTLNY